MHHGWALCRWGLILNASWLRIVAAGGAAGRATTNPSKRKRPTNSKDSSRGGGGGGADEPRRRRPNYLTNELPDMMFGFGDVETPMQSTVDVVDDLVSAYVRDLVQKAAANSVQSDNKGRRKLSAEDGLLLIRKDPVKYQRAIDLLGKWEDVKNARKNGFEVDGEQL